MIEKINVCQNVRILQNHAFRARQDSGTVTPPVENISMKGADALASYNSVLVQNKDKFNIPLLKPVDMPKDIYAAEGEKVYTPEGNIEFVVKETDDKKYLYFSEREDSSEVDKLIIQDKNGNMIRSQEMFIYNDSDGEHRRLTVTKYDPVTGFRVAETEYEGMNPYSKSEYIQKPDGSYERRTYDFGGISYNISGYNAQETLSYDYLYSPEKNIVEEYSYKYLPDGTLNNSVKYIDGIKVSHTITKQQAIQVPEYLKYINNPDMIPADCPDFLTSIDNIEGEKTYYSNGQLESVRTEDGKMYEINKEGDFITLYDGNKTTEFADYKAYNDKNCTITEDLGNAEKVTRYEGAEGNLIGSVHYTKDNIEKSVYYNNGFPQYYCEYDLSKEDWDDGLIIDIEYASNGGILDVRLNGD